MYLLLDHQDSFLYNLKAYIEELHHQVLVMPAATTTVEDVQKLPKLQGIILSPGPGHPQEALNTQAIIKYFKNKIPILGVCLGHQLLAFCHNAQIIHGPQPMHGKVTPIYHQGQGLFKDLSSPFQVVRYHSLIVDKNTLPADWSIDALDENNIIMGMHHQVLPLFGVQFHPEAFFSQYGHQLLHNFCAIAQAYVKEENHDNK